MKKRLLSIWGNDRGDVTFFSIVFIMVMFMLMAFLLLYSSIQIQTMNIRDGIKMELNNLSAKVYADTFRSQREANLPSYRHRLTESSSYMESLERSFRRGLEKKVSLETEDYRISDMHLDFREENDEIRYTLRCRVEFFISMFGGNLPPVQEEIILTGSHRTKY